MKLAKFHTFRTNINIKNNFTCSISENLIFEHFHLRRYHISCFEKIAHTEKIIFSKRFGIFKNGLKHSHIEVQR